MGKELVKEIIRRYESDSGMLIPMLQDLQAEHGYLPADQLKKLSKQLEIPLSRIYSVATFYASFRMAPKGQHEVTLCMGTVCYLKGADKISETICREFKVEPGGATPDRLFSYQPVNCVGACALAPVMVVDGEYHDGVTPDSAMDILNGLSTDDDGGGEKQPPEKKAAAKSASSSKTIEKPKPKAAVKKAASKPKGQAKAQALKKAAAKPIAKTQTKTEAAKGKVSAQKTTTQNLIKKVHPKAKSGKKESSS